MFTFVNTALFTFVTVTIQLWKSGSGIRQILRLDYRVDM